MSSSPRMSLEEEMILAMANVTKDFLSLVNFPGFQSKAIDEGPTGKLLSTHSHNPSSYSSNSDYVGSKIGLVGIESHCKEIVNTSALIPCHEPISSESSWLCESSVSHGGDRIGCYITGGWPLCRSFI